MVVLLDFGTRTSPIEHAVDGSFPEVWRFE